MKYKTLIPASGYCNTGEVEYPAGALVEVEPAYRGHSLLTFNGGESLAVWSNDLVLQDLIPARPLRRAFDSMGILEVAA